MAEIGNGYGSEFQLMRFLGHHREELELALYRVWYKPDTEETS